MTTPGMWAIAMLIAGMLQQVQAGGTDVPERHLTGNLRVDLFGPESVRPSGLSPAFEDEPAVPYKSPWLAAGFSLLLPGAGEYYAESYWKAAAFFAIEVAAWSFAYSFDKRGDDQTDFYRGYADEHWNVVAYAQFAEANFPASGAPYRWRIPGTAGRPPWEQVDWTELNRMERDIGRTPEGQYYSHTLPLYGEQQYYELIGKYQQYYQGWSDADPSLVTYDQIAAFLRNNPDARFQFYSRERGKANDYYNKATTSVTIAVINHVLSAIDAAWSAGAYNSMQVRVGMQSVPTRDEIARVPVVRLTYGF